jgi:hypothetical protein
MNTTYIGESRFWRAGRRSLAAIIFLVCPALANAAITEVIIDSNGFEAPTYSTTNFGTGQLEGQPPGGVGPEDASVWLKSETAPGDGEGFAKVQSTEVFSGSQAVEVTRVADSYDRWAPSIQGQPFFNCMCIQWDMKVLDAGGSLTGAYGPFFGVEAYDDDGPIALFGSLGVDASTGDVMLQQEDTGDFLLTGEIVDFDEWYHYDMTLDFDAQTYSVYLDGVLLATEPFVDGNLPALGGSGLNEFTDAPITAVSANNDPLSFAIGGTAFFDNYVVSQGDVVILLTGSVVCGIVPEPSTCVLAACFLLPCMVRPCSRTGVRFA